MAQSVAELQKKIQGLQAELDARLEAVSAQSFQSEKPRLQEWMQESVLQSNERLRNIQQQINERLNTLSQGYQQEELLQDIDLKDLEELFKKAFKGEDIKNLGQGVLQYGAQGFMSDFGPGGMLKNLIDLLKQVGTRREIHFPERYKQRNYDITLPDESGFQWPEFKPELEKSGKVGEQQALQARPRPLRPGPKGIRSPQR
jgi:exonuclease VII large subunit